MGQLHGGKLSSRRARDRADSAASPRATIVATCCRSSTARTMEEAVATQEGMSSTTAEFARSTRPADFIDNVMRDIVLVRIELKGARDRATAHASLVAQSTIGDARCLPGYARRFGRPWSSSRAVATMGKIGNMQPAIYVYARCRCPDDLRA
jgi:hypothetical protein